jgi:hypothetical protein
LAEITPEATSLPSLSDRSARTLEVGEDEFALSSLSALQQAVLNVVLAHDVFLKQHDIAAILNVPASSVARAMRDEKYKRAYVGICSAYSHMRLQEVVNSMTDAAAGSVKHQELYFKFHRILWDRAHDAPPVRDVGNDVERLMKRKAEIEKELKEQYHVTDVEGVEVHDGKKD